MNVFKALGGFLSKNERTILTGISIGCEVIAIVEAFRQTPKFKQLAEEINNKSEKGEEIDKVEVAKKAVGPALKVAVPAGISIAAQVINHRKVTAVLTENAEKISSLTSLYMLAKEGKEAYKQQVAETHGQEEADRIDREVIKKKFEADMASGYCDHHVYETGHGNVLFYDEMSGRYFRSDINYVERVINELNKRLIESYDHMGCVEWNELYEELGLPTLDIGYEKVWTLTNGLISHRITSDIDENNQLYAVLKITNKPKYLDQD